MEPGKTASADSPHVSQLGRKEMKSAWLGVVRLFYVALLVAHRVFRFEQESVAL
jgi:hypothetical protein